MYLPNHIVSNLTFSENESSIYCSNPFPLLEETLWTLRVFLREMTEVVDSLVPGYRGKPKVKVKVHIPNILLANLIKFLAVFSFGTNQQL